jgi:anion-transporting  ArsA/GET3 family ATPase
MLAEKIAQFIHNKSTFLVFANTEALVINLVRRVINTHTEYHLSIHGLIINKTIAETDSLSLATMRFFQMRHIEEIKKRAERRHESTLSFSLAEIKGLKRLQDLGEKLVADPGL